MPTVLQILNIIASIRDGDQQGTLGYVVSNCVEEEWSAKAQGWPVTGCFFFFAWKDRYQVEAKMGRRCYSGSR